MIFRSVPAGYHVHFNAALAGINAMWLTAVAFGPATGMPTLVAAAAAGVLVGVLAVPVQGAYLRGGGSRRIGSDPLYLRQMIVMAVLIGGLVGFFAGNVLAGVVAAGGLAFAALHHRRRDVAAAEGRGQAYPLGPGRTSRSAPLP